MVANSVGFGGKLQTSDQIGNPQRIGYIFFFPVLSLFYIFIIPFSMVSHPFDRCGFKRHIDGPHGKAI